MLERVWRKGNPPTVCSSKLVQLLQRTLWRLPTKLKTQLPYDSAIPLLVHVQTKSCFQMIHLPTLTVALFITANIWKQRKCPLTDEWIKTWYMLSCVWHFETPGTVAHQAPLSMKFSRQEYWSRLPFLLPRDLPDPRIKPTSLNVSCIGRWVLYQLSHQGTGAAPAIMPTLQTRRRKLHKEVGAIGQKQ